MQNKRAISPIIIGIIFLILTRLFGFISFIFLGFILSLFFTNKKDQKQTAMEKRHHKYKIKLTKKNEEQINYKLKEYFTDNDRLIVIDGISLRPLKGSYENLKNLNMYYNEECIATLDEFASSYPSVAQEIYDLLVNFANKEVKEKPKVQESPKRIEPSATLYMNRINQLNNEIEHEEISNGLYKTASLLKNIEVIEQKDPNSKEQLTKLYSYYMPILVDILEKYKSLSLGDVNNQEYLKSEEQLIKTIVLINEALKNIVSTLNEDDYMHLSADITTLQSLLKKDGLVDEGTLKVGNDYER